MLIFKRNKSRAYKMGRLENHIMFNCKTFHQIQFASIQESYLLWDCIEFLIKFFILLASWIARDISFMLHHQLISQLWYLFKGSEIITQCDWFDNIIRHLWIILSLLSQKIHVVFLDSSIWNLFLQANFNPFFYFLRK